MTGQLSKTKFRGVLSGAVAILLALGVSNGIQTLLADTALASLDGAQTSVESPGLMLSLEIPIDPNAPAYVPSYPPSSPYASPFQSVSTPEQREEMNPAFYYSKEFFDTSDARVKSLHLEVIDI